MNGEELWRLRIERELGELTIRVGGHDEKFDDLDPKVARHEKLITLALALYTAACAIVVFFAGPITDFFKTHLHLK